MHYICLENMSCLLVFLLMTFCSQTFAKYSLSNQYVAVGYNHREIFLVLHYTVSDLKRSLQILTGNRVSSHYVVPQTPIDGIRKIYQLVPEEKRAWTQGVSQWGRRSNLNDQGIGVEIINSGYKLINGVRVFYPFPSYQIQSVIELSQDIIARYQIKPINVIGHADCAPERKEDPGPLFPWKELHKNNIGAWPDDADVKLYKALLFDNIDIKAFQVDLNKYGYNVNTNGNYTSQTKRAVQAFQMHFRQSKYDGVIDKETYAVLKALLKKYF